MNKANVLIANESRILRKQKEMSSAEQVKLKKQLQLINEAVSNDIYNLGDQFFEKIVLKLNEVLAADYTFIGKLSEDKTQVETISTVNKQGVIDDFVYDLKYTPCENVIGQNPCSYSKNISVLFPHDQLLIDMDIEGYVGVPLYDSKKDPTGILVCLYENEIKDTYAIESILMIFASRASAELEHMKLYSSLEKHKQELELKVAERTNELNLKNAELESTNQALGKTLLNLQHAQSQLVQSEKMASLGILTSGVAHEINNPLNYLMGAFLGLTSYFQKYESHEKQTTDILLNSMNEGIERIANIVQGLNQFSRSNEGMEEECNIHSILNNCFEMLYHQTKHKAEIERNYWDEELVVKGNSGKLHQIFLNILLNSTQALTNHGKITASTLIEEGSVRIEIKDNGIGVEEKLINKVTDPFFTTKPPGEGTGLGLSISHSIIKEHQGTFEFTSVLNKGTTVIITIPFN